MKECFSALPEKILSPFIPFKRRPLNTPCISFLFGIGIHPEGEREGFIELKNPP
jgi:hypothetical protein